VIGNNSSFINKGENNILFVEIWDIENQLITRHIHTIQNSYTCGIFPIAEHINSGWKIIRVYSQTPYPANQITYVHLPILVVDYDAEEQDIIRKLQNSFHPEIPAAQTIKTVQLDLNVNQPEIEGRQSIQVKVEIPDHLKTNEKIDLIAMARFGEFFPIMNCAVYNSFNNGYVIKHKLNRAGQDEGIPKGLFLNGKYVIPEEEREKVYEMITLAVFGDNPGIFFTYTNSKDEFSFNITDLTGDLRIYLSAINGKSDKIEIITDSIPPLQLEYNKSSMEDWLAPLRNYQKNSKTRKIISDNYSSINKLDSSRLLTIYDTTRLYETADRSYKLSDYVAFSSVKELIIEILPFVKIKEEKGHSEILIYNSQNPELNMGGPLFLINGIPSRDNDFVAGLDVQNIDVIEVLFSKETLYPFNWMGRGGVLAIYTKIPIEIPNHKYRKMKGIYMDKGSFIIQNPVNETEFYTPNIEPLIYWNPVLQKDDSIDIEFNFISGDQTGSLNIIVFGMTANGELLYGNSTVQVVAFRTEKTGNK
jgi:hypothetical protein